MARASRPDSSSHDRDHPTTSFLITAAIFSCIYCTLVAVSCAYMPDDPLKIALGISLYAWAGTILSVLGLAGIVTKTPILITAFANFLLVDTFLSAACRFLVVQIFAEAFNDHGFCGTSGFEPSTWNPRNFRHGVVTSMRWQQANLAKRERRCSIAQDAIQVVLFAVLTCLAVGQGMLAVKMRRFGKALEKSRFSTVGYNPCPYEKPRRSPQPPMVREKEKAYLDAV